MGWLVFSFAATLHRHQFRDQKRLLQWLSECDDSTYRHAGAHGHTNTQGHAHPHTVTPSLGVVILKDRMMMMMMMIMMLMLMLVVMMMRMMRDIQFLDTDSFLPQILPKINWCFLVFFWWTLLVPARWVRLDGWWFDGDDGALQRKHPTRKPRHYHNGRVKPLGWLCSILAFLREWLGGQVLHLVSSLACGLIHD